MMQLQRNTLAVRTRLVNLSKQINGHEAIEEERAKYHSSKIVQLALTLYGKAQQQKDILKKMLEQTTDEVDLRKRREMDEMKRITHGRYTLEDMKRMQDMRRMAERDSAYYLDEMQQSLLARVKQTQLYNSQCKGIYIDGKGAWRLMSMFGKDDEHFPKALKELDLRDPRDLERFMTLAKNPETLYAHVIEVYEDDKKEDIFQSSDRGNKPRIDATDVSTIRETLHDDREDINQAQERVNEAMLGIGRSQILVTNLRKLKQQHYGVANTIQQQFNDVLDIYLRLEKAKKNLDEMQSEAKDKDKQMLSSLSNDVQLVLDKANKAMENMSEQRKIVLQQYRNWRSLADNPNVARPMTKQD
jgi:SepF-like predicted cell division protein (DUF552 family)